MFYYFSIIVLFLPSDLHLQLYETYFASTLAHLFLSLHLILSHSQLLLYLEDIIYLIDH